ncbi:ATP-binding protein [Bacteroides fluxus]|nr:ATP-binding protein [Bacteroides fluxus]
MRKCLFLSLLLGLLWAVPETLSAAEHTYDVLFIQSYTSHTPWHSRLTTGLKSGFEKGGAKVNIVTEYLNADFWTFPSECFIMRRICERARQRNTDMIVTSGDEAFYTLVHCGDSLPYRLPVVVSGIKYPDENVLKKMPNVSGYVSKPDFSVLLEEAIRMFPSRTEIVCLSDSSFLSRKGGEQVEEVWEGLKQKYPKHSLKKMNVQAQSLNSIITSICYDYNAYKHIVIAPKWIPFLSLKLKSPVFASQNLAMTNGVLCVYDVVPSEDTYAAGKWAARILKGKEPFSLGVTNFTGKLLYDYKQLEFFHIDAGRVEAEGGILNVPLVERYRVWFIFFYSVVVGALVLLVVWLYRMNRRESRRRIHAQTRLLIQHRLVEQRDEFDNIFCSIRDGLITYDIDFRIHFVNRSLMMMLGVDSEVHTARYYEGQMAGSIFRIYMDGEDVLHKLLKQVYSERKPVPIPENAFMQEKDKENYFPISGEVVPIFSNEQLTGMAIVCRNISEEEMQRRFFNMAVEESSIYPWQYNMHMNCFYFPEGLLKRFNILADTEFLTREDLDRLIHPDDLPHTRVHFDSILLGRELNSRMNFRLQHVGGGYEWWEFRSTAYNGLKPEAPYMVLGVCQSIQKYKDTEEALIAARDRALQADKLKSAFLANMSHEIRTPLNAIVGFSDLLQNLDVFTPEEVKQFVETININCTLLLALMNDILDMSRIESGTMDFQFESHDLTSVLQQVYDSQRLSMPQGVELRTGFPEEEGKSILTDSVRLKQVVNNLINNAKKFTVAGSITFGYLMDEPDYTTLYVEDTGSGISEEDQKHIFERFYKADNFTQGAGLGLSICHTIVNRLQGEIAVSSQFGKGTRFEVRLPDGIRE